MEVVITDRIGVIGADAVAELVARRPDAVLGLATGSSPTGIYAELARRVGAGELDLGRCRGFLLDEYVGLPADHPERYRAVIERELVEPCRMDPVLVRGLDGLADDPVAECAGYERAIRDAGGVDLQVLGVGSNGHVAFNEPGSSLGSRTRMKTLTRQTRVDNSRYFDGGVDAVPRHCLTQGVATILEARHLLLVAAGEAKAEAIRQVVEGPVSARWPATAIQLHPHCTVVVDDAAAARLELADYYRDAWQSRPAGQEL